MIGGTAAGADNVRLVLDRYESIRGVRLSSDLQWVGPHRLDVGYVTVEGDVGYVTVEGASHGTLRVAGPDLLAGTIDGVRVRLRSPFLVAR